MIGASDTTTIVVTGVEGVPLIIEGVGVQRDPNIVKTRLSTHPCRITSLNSGGVCTTSNNSMPFRRKRLEIWW
jgi:hypothetical protein